MSKEQSGLGVCTSTEGATISRKGIWPDRELSGSKVIKRMNSETLARKMANGGKEYKIISLGGFM
jgi:hypothetical protein